MENFIELLLANYFFSCIFRFFENSFKDLMNISLELIEKIE